MFNSTYTEADNTSIFPPVQNMFASSANIMKCNISEILQISLIYTMNYVMPYVGLWGTPQITFNKSELISLMLTNIR